MKQHRKQASLKIRRMGSPATLLRKSGGTTNRLGKTTGETWEPVGDEYAVLNQGKGRSRRQMVVSGGEYDQSNLILTLFHDSNAQDGDRIVMKGTTYEIQTLVPYSTHKTAQVVSVNGQS